jgi:hypothetical protein
MSGPDGVLGEQDIAGVKQEMLAPARLEIQRATQRNDQLPNWRSVPGEGAARCRFLEGDGGHGEFVAQPIAARTRCELDYTFLEIRILVIAGP